jgi:uncharacterized repeat protein (TIGR01451 family)
MKSPVYVTNRKRTASFRIAGLMLAIAPLWLMLATANSSAHAQTTSSSAVKVLGAADMADLYLRVEPSPTAVKQGDLLTYTFPVWNLGPGDAVHEVLTTQVPEGTTFDYIRISGTPGLGTCTHPPYQGTGQIVCHENSSMAPNTTWTVRLTVRVTAAAGTVITENAATMADTPDPNLANNTAAVSIIGSAAAQTSCSRSITSCGCTITERGVYSVDADLSASQGLTALNGCIDINAEHTDLFLNYHSISGDKAGTGIGIHVLPAAKYAFLFFQSTYLFDPGIKAVSGWRFGIESEADNVIIAAPNTTDNSTGILLKGTYDNKLSGESTTGTINNSAYGIWIVGGNSNQVDLYTSQGNGIAGIYVGCSATGPTGTPCPSGQASSGNVIYDNSDNGTNQLYGVVLEAGSLRNTVMNTSIASNTRFDAFDGNAHCANNLWRINKIHNANAACIQ